MDYKREPMPRWAKIMWIVYLALLAFVVWKSPLWFAGATVILAALYALVEFISYCNRNMPE